MTETESISKMRALLGMLDYELRAIEGLEPKAEQMQSVARQQDAALSPDESGRSAAGNPTDWIEAFEVWLDNEIKAADDRYRREPSGDLAISPLVLKWIRGNFQQFRSRGAA